MKSKQKHILIGILIASITVIALLMANFIPGPSIPSDAVEEPVVAEPEEPVAEEPEEPVVAEPEEPALFSSDFEDKTTQGWKSRMGTEQIVVSQEAARSGSDSLKVTGRAEPFMGPAIDMLEKMLPGERYEISVWVRLPADATAMPMVLSVQRTTGERQSFDNIVRGVSADSQNWVQLSGVYQFAEAVDGLEIYVETVEGLGSFYIDDFRLVHIPVARVRKDIPALKDFFADYFTIGAAVELQHLAGMHAEMLNMHYNVLVAENAMKPVSLQPVEGHFTFGNADRIRDFARDNNMKLRFHTLVWHSQVPGWFFIDEDGNPMVDETDPDKREANKNLLLDRLETHIRTVVERYRDDVDYWEVVNEVIDPNQPDGMRDSEWYRITGKEFIKRAFQVTREVAGEDAILSINDYNTHNPRKRDIMFDLVMYLREQGIRVDAIGHQTHISLYYPAISLIPQSIRKFGEAGFANHITELDISVYRYGDLGTRYQVVPDEVLLRLAHRYRDLFNGLREARDHIDDVTFWGIADDHTWLHNRPVPRRDAPFLFDEMFQPKEAFWAIIDPNWTPSE